ncbi:MAG: toxin-antitoxin system YwqK family antitoxin [Bacteroidales bacterium]
MLKNIKFIPFFILMVLFVNGQESNDTINRLDEKGLKQGYWIKYGEGGLLKYEGRFVDDIPQGEFIYYYPDEKVKARSEFSQGGDYVKTTTYHYSGNIMTKGFYKNKEKDSLWTYYNSEGTLLTEEFYLHNKKDGNWKTYYDNGQVSEEITWDKGKRNGPWKQYYADGAIKTQGAFADDEKHGLIEFYYPNGRIQITGTYDKSYRVGEWHYMDEQSRVVKIEYYSADGELTREESFDYD